MKIKAVVFDIDGTMYDDKLLVPKMFWKVIFNLKFFLAFSKIRKEIRELQIKFGKDSNREEFLEYQNSLLRQSLKMSDEKINQKLEGFFYGEYFENLFKKLKAFPDLKNLILDLKKQGYKLGVVSDFPIGRRVEYLLGIDNKFWDIIYSSEDVGYLKPHKKVFKGIIKKLGVEGKEILYVGNSYKYDIIGASSVCLQTAYIGKRKDVGSTCFKFNKYEDLRKYILEN